MTKKLESQKLEFVSVEAYYTVVAQRNELEKRVNILEDRIRRAVIFDATHQDYVSSDLFRILCGGK